MRDPFSLSPAAATLREQIVSRARPDNAARASNAAAMLINNYLNGLVDRRMLTVADSLMARALIARGTIGAASAWWSDISKAPRPETWAALLSMQLDLPANYEMFDLDESTGEIS